MDDEVRSILISRLRRLGASREDAEDCVQEAMAAAWSKHVEGQQPRDLLAWLTTVARRRYVDLVRADRRHSELSRRVMDELDRTDATPEQQIVERVHTRWLAARMEALPQQTQEVCERASAGSEPAEIVADLGLRPRSVEAHLYRARRYLRIQAALGIPTLIGAAWRWLRGHSVTVGATATCAAVSMALLFLPSTEAPAQEPVAQPPPALHAPDPIDGEGHDSAVLTPRRTERLPVNPDQPRGPSSAPRELVSSSEPGRVHPRSPVEPPVPARPALIGVNDHPEQIRSRIDAAVRTAAMDIPACAAPAVLVQNCS